MKMPAAITHYLHAQRVYNLWKEKNPDLIGNQKAFLWGAQGPDFFFTHRFLPVQKGKSLEMLGGKLHSAPPAKTLQILWECALKTVRPEVARSYVYGFICHYVLDRTCHPFIERKAADLLQQDPAQTHDIFHNQVESALDVIMLRYEKGSLPAEFSIKKTVPRDKMVQRTIAELYQKVLKDLFDMEESENILFQATQDCRKIFGLLTDRTGLKKKLVERFERKNKKKTISCHMRGMLEEDIDYANLQQDEWCWPLDASTSCQDSFFDLYEKSVEDAVDMIEQIPTCTDFKMLTQDIPFD